MLTCNLADNEGEDMLPAMKDKLNTEKCLQGNYQNLSDEEAGCTTAIFHDVDADLKSTVCEHTSEGQHPDNMDIEHRKLLCCVC